MKIQQIMILAMIISSAIFTSFASENAEYNNNESSIVNMNLNYENAKEMVIKENTDVIIESIQGRLIEKKNYGTIWEMTTKAASNRSIVTGIDASNGEVLFVYDGTKQNKGNMNLTEQDALKTANKYIESKVSADKLDSMELKSIVYKEPVAADLPAIYRVIYSRIINGIPTLSDGIQLRVNAETGDITSYRKKWSMTEDEIISIETKPSINEEESIQILKEYMTSVQSIGLEESNSVEVISTSLVWFDNTEDGTHLAWWIRFMDSSFEADDTYPASVWIDAHSGKVLLFDYYKD